MRMVALAAGLAMTGLLPHQAHAQSLYAAIAWSPSTNEAGASWNAHSQAEAESDAVRRCRSVRGHYDCRSMVYARDSCAALAVGNRLGYGIGWGLTKDTAGANAISACSPNDSGCDVRYWVCSGTP